MALSEVFNLDFKFGGNSEFLSRLEKLMERVDARFDSVTDDVKEATDETKKMADAVDDLSDSFNRGMGSLSSFGEKLKDIAKYYLSFSAAKMGAEKVWSFGMQSMNAFATQERAENQLKGVMRNRGTLDQFQAIKDYAADIQSRSIYGDEAMIKGAGELATYVKGTDSLKSMMDLLTDYAAGMTGGGEVSPEQMESLATGLGMAYDGNYMAMRRKGFDTSKLEAYDAIVETGGRWGAKEKKKYGDVLTDEEIKRIRKLGGVSEQMRVDALKEALGDWKGLSDSVNNLDSSAIIRFNNALGDLRENLGKKIYPTFNKLVSTIEKRMPDIESLFASIGDVFKTIADSIKENIGKLIDFGKWMSNFVTSLVKFGGTVINSIGKVIELSDAFKLLLTYMSVQKIREFSDEFNKVMNGNGKEGGVLNEVNNFMEAMEGEGGLTTALDNFSKSAIGTQVAIIGITWGLEKIAELGSAFFEWLDALKDEKEAIRLAKIKSNAAAQMIAAKQKYNRGEISEEQYKRTFDTLNKATGVDFKGSYFDIWKEDVASKAAKAAQKSTKGEANLHQSFTTINQEVTLTPRAEQIGVMLNQRVRRIIENQMKRNQEIAII
jgi:archaellum component FlaC